MSAALIAALCGLGVVVLGSGMYRWRRRAVTSRRVAALMVEAPLQNAQRPAVVERAVPRWQLELRQVLAQLEARDSVLRGPTIGLACVCAFIGLASISPGWIVLAALAGLAAYLVRGGERRRR
ncbi:MAG TPA: hypothetical protein VGE94_03875, partial [Chloroflexota bacterium]